MPSCSNSSNISSTLNAISVSQGGSRLIVAVPYVAGLTDGNVIRYDVPSSGYTASKANDAPNSEVFGVIEGYDAATNKFNVVIYGSISINASRLADMGSGGGSGGNDVYFLSGNTAGILQNLAPTNPDHIIKPVYQVSPHGSYSGVVVNYLGYRIGGEIQGFVEDTELGNLQILVGNNNFANGFIDASISHSLPISDYSDYYEKYGTQYGYVEQVTVSGAIPGSIVNGMNVYQNSNVIGTVSGSPSTPYIYILKNPNSSLVSTNAPLVINNLSITITATEVYAVKTPLIQLAQPLTISGQSGLTTIPTQVTAVGIKVQPQGLKVSIPSTVSINVINLGKTAGSQFDLETKLNDFESRISALEAS